MDVDPTSDVALIGGDPDLLEAFYREHVEAVQRFVARRVADPHTAADLTAEVFLAVIDAAPRYDPRRGEPRAWVFGIARHVVAGEHRRLGRQQRVHLRAAGRRDLEPDALERAIERLDAEQDARSLLAELRVLPAAQRAVVELVAVDQLSVVEAAVVLGVSPGAARVRLHRARRRLGDRLPLLAVPTEESLA